MTFKIVVLSLVLGIWGLDAGKPEYKEGLLHAADSLAMLYNPVVGTILSWPGMVKKENWPHNTIIAVSYTHLS